MNKQMMVAVLAVYAAAIHPGTAQTTGNAPRPLHATRCTGVSARATAVASSYAADRARSTGLGESVVFTLDTIFLSEFECATGGPYGGGEPSGPGGSVSATVVEQNNAPVSGQPAYLCGLNICAAPKSTNAGGGVTISTSITMTRPAFHVGDGINYPIVAVQLPPNVTTNFGTLQSGAFPATFRYPLLPAHRSTSTHWPTRPATNRSSAP